jgi:hypothetical protein
MTMFPETMGRHAYGMHGDSVSAPLHHHFTDQCRLMSGPWACFSALGYTERLVEDFEGEPEVAPEPVPEVVREEAAAEGAMIAVRAVAAHPSSRGARAPPSLVSRRATASRATTDEGMEVVLGHPTPYALGDISVGEAVSTAHQALSQT